MMRPAFSSVLLSLAMSIDEVRHLWLRIKAVNILLNRAVGQNHTLVLAQVFCPGFHDEGFHIVRWALRIAINAPAVRAIAPAYARQFLKSGEKFLRLVRFNEVFHCKQHRTQVEANVTDKN